MVETYQATITRKKSILQTPLHRVVILCHDRRFYNFSVLLNPLEEGDVVD